MKPLEKNESLSRAAACPLMAEAHGDGYLPGPDPVPDGVSLSKNAVDRDLPMVTLRKVPVTPLGTTPA